MLLRAPLGLEPDPAHRCLIVAPTLPAWLPALTLRNLTVFGHSVDLRFQGVGPAGTAEVLRNPGGIKIERQCGDRPVALPEREG